MIQSILSEIPYSPWNTQNLKPSLLSLGIELWYVSTERNETALVLAAAGGDNMEFRVLCLKR